MDKHYIVGTAGHIDHGKTSLSKALTGKETDRLKEEKSRNISIELGFAPFNLINGDQVSLIDVPGHEKFIRHMVAGVGGIDLVLFIIAADEGVMPQTREHLQILQLLGIEHGIIVLTKKDLVEEDFLELVKEDVMNLLKDTKLKNAPVTAVSSTTNEGIEELKILIQNELIKIPERSYSGFFRMPIDRVFTLRGIGTVITGTVYSGKVEAGQELEIMPSAIPVKVRNLQVHSKSVNAAFAGQRVAINLTGIEIEEINRGDSVVTQNQWHPSKRVDVELNLSKGIDFSIKQNGEVKFYIGTREVLGSLILYDRKEALPGETIYCQIRMHEPIISSRKERFIIRRASPAITIGGGAIIEPNAKKHKYNQETITHLQNKSKGSLEDLITNILTENTLMFLTSKELSNLLNLPEKELKEPIANLISDNKVISFAEDIPFYVETGIFHDMKERVNQHLSKYHKSFPLRIGQPKAEFLSLFMPKIKAKISQTVLEFWQAKKIIKIHEEYISLYNFEPTLSESLKKTVSILESKLIQQNLNPETWQDLIKDTGIKETDANEIYNFLLNSGKILKLTDKIVIHQKAFSNLKNLITDYLQKHEKITLQEAKEILQVSRKYLVPLMELLDQEKVTVLRQGHNYRVLRSNSTSS